jgi:hypothetical protein
MKWKSNREAELLVDLHKFISSLDQTVTDVHNNLNHQNILLRHLLRNQFTQHKTTCILLNILNARLLAITGKGDIVVERTKVNIEKVFYACIFIIKYLFDNKVKLVSKVSADVPMYVYCNETWFQALIVQAVSMFVLFDRKYSIDISLTVVDKALNLEILSVDTDSIDVSSKCRKAAITKYKRVFYKKSNGILKILSMLDGKMNIDYNYTVKNSFTRFATRIDFRLPLKAIKHEDSFQNFKSDFSKHINVICCDDSPVILEVLNRQIKKILPHCKLTVTKTLETLIKAINQLEGIIILILDVHLKEQNALLFLDKLMVTPIMDIIICTGSHMTDNQIANLTSTHLRHLNLLRKPVHLDQLKVNINTSMLSIGCVNVYLLEDQSSQSNTCLLLYQSLYDMGFRVLRNLTNSINRVLITFVEKNYILELSTNSKINDLISQNVLYVYSEDDASKSEPSSPRTPKIKQPESSWKLLVLPFTPDDLKTILHKAFVSFTAANS